MQIGTSGQQDQGMKLLWNCVTLTFDLLTPTLIVSSPCHVEHYCQFAANQFFHFQNHKINNKQMDEQMRNGQMVR